MFSVSGTFLLDGDFLLIFSLVGLLSGGLSFGGTVKQFLVIYKSLLDLNRFGVPENFNKFNETTDFYSKFSFVYSQFIIILAVASPIFEYNTCLKRKNDICGVVNTWAPFDITASHYRPIMYLITLFTYYVVFSTILSITFFSAILSRYLIFRLSYVKVLLRKTYDAHDYEEKRQNLFRAIEYHHEILR